MNRIIVIIEGIQEKAEDCKKIKNQVLGIRKLPKQELLTSLKMQLSGHNPVEPKTFLAACSFDLWPL